MKFNRFKTILSGLMLVLGSLLSAQAHAISGSLDSTTGDAATSVTVTATITNDNSAFGVTYHIQYDPAVLTTPVVNYGDYSGVSLKSDSLLVNTPAGLNTVVVNFGDFGAALVDGNFTIDFNILGTAAVGASTLNFIAVESTSNVGAILDTNKALTSGQVTVNPPPAPEVSITATDGAEGGANGTFELSCTGGDGSDVDVILSTSGTASAADFTAIATPVTIACPSSANAPIDVIITDDIDVEDDETVVITIGDGGAAYDIETGTATVTIADNDSLPVVTLTTSDSNAEESEAIPTLDDGQFTLSCSVGNVATVDLDITIGGTAISGTDYTALNIPAPFPCDGSTVLVDVTVLNDGDSGEPTETVTLTLNSHDSYEGTGSGSVSIKGDRLPATPVPTLGVWAMMLMALFLMFIAVPMVRTRQS